MSREFFCPICGAPIVADTYMTFIQDEKGDWKPYLPSQDSINDEIENLNTAVRCNGDACGTPFDANHDPINLKEGEDFFHYWLRINNYPEDIEADESMDAAFKAWEEEIHYYSWEGVFGDAIDIEGVTARQLQAEGKLDSSI